MEYSFVAYFISLTFPPGIPSGGKGRGII